MQKAKAKSKGKRQKKNYTLSTYGGVGYKTHIILCDLYIYNIHFFNIIGFD